MSWLELAFRIVVRSCLETTWVAFPLTDDVSQPTMLVPGFYQPLSVFLQSQFTRFAHHRAEADAQPFGKFVVERRSEVTFQVIDHCLVPVDAHGTSFLHDDAS